jgi:hypothetical protein
MRAFVVMVALAAMSAPGFAAGPSEKWGHDPDTSEWFKSLKNPQGFPCCDYTDGTRIEDPDYRENDDGSYEVFAHAQWVHVDKEKIVTGTNRVGYAILWWSNAAPLPYCFLPGARG